MMGLVRGRVARGVIHLMMMQLGSSLGARQHSRGINQRVVSSQTRSTKRSSSSRRVRLSRLSSSCKFSSGHPSCTFEARRMHLFRRAACLLGGPAAVVHRSAGSQQVVVLLPRLGSTRLLLQVLCRLAP